MLTILLPLLIWSVTEKLGNAANIHIMVYNVKIDMVVAALPIIEG